MKEDEENYLDLPISMAFVCHGRLGDFKKIKDYIETLKETNLIYCKKSTRKKLYVQTGELDDRR